jgi:hypothetical protein
MRQLLIFLLLCLSVYSPNSAELIKGTFIESNNNYIYSFKSPELSPDKVWLNRVQSISPNMPIWISDDGNKIAINKGLNLSNTIQITLQSHAINSTDNLLALNQIQLIGTHNSYHIAPHSSVMQLIRKVMPSQADSIKYSHRPLTEQLELIGMRKFELDIFHDNKGGGYSQPLGAIMAHGINWKGNYPEFDEDALKDPGMKVLHFPNFDFRSNTPSLIKALNEIEAWSIKNSYHLPIMILIETKNTGNGSSGFGIKDFVELEKEIKSVLNLSRIITPDEVRGKFSTLNKAIRTKGWPSLYKSRGRFIFALDNQGKELDSYLKLHPQLKGAILFVSSPPGRPESAFLKINDPIRNHSLIKEKITEGYLIRTRADSDLAQAKNMDYKQMQKAFSSGAQYISTDFPADDSTKDNYNVGWPGGKIGRLNPLFKHSKKMRDTELEQKGYPKLIRVFELKIPNNQPESKNVSQ